MEIEESWETLLDQVVEETAEGLIRILKSSYALQLRLKEKWVALMAKSEMDSNRLLAMFREKLIKKVSEDPRVPEEARFMVADWVYSGLRIGVEAAKVRDEGR